MTVHTETSTSRTAPRSPWMRGGIHRLSSALRGRTAGDTLSASATPILDSEMFQVELLRQRALADRQGVGFVLMSFHFVDSDNGWSNLKYVGEVVRRRARTSDVVGWDDVGGPRVSVIFPASGEDAVQGFVRDIRSLLADSSAAPKHIADLEVLCEVEVYEGCEETARQNGRKAKR